MTVWWTIGFSMLLYLSALQDISTDIYEAASIDGATKRQQLFSRLLDLLQIVVHLRRIVLILAG